MRSTIKILTPKSLKKLLESCKDEEEIKSALINHYGLPMEIYGIGECGFCAIWRDGKKAIVENTTVELRRLPDYCVKKRERKYL